MTKILISGLPGGGKTKLGDTLAAEHGYFHADMEADNWALTAKAHTDLEAFLRAFPDDRDVVVTWGFQPLASLQVVQVLVRRGFTPVWLDGNRAHFFASFMQREHDNPVMQACYHQQLGRITQARVLEAITWRIVNPFQPGGTFRPPSEIAAEILKVDLHP
jgi:adenylate kinase family enzyme